MLFRKMSICFIVLLFLVSSLPVLGQAVNATLLGTVTDSTGASVSNASVTAIETKTGTLHQSVSNESGNYTFPDLQPGTYAVTVESTGFKKGTHQNIVLLVNSSTRVDVILQPGSVSESVLVTTAPPLLQTDRADISTKIESQQIANLPIGTNQNFQSLLNTVPGTSPAVFQRTQFFNAQDALQTEVNGVPFGGNLYQIEGIDDDERTGMLQIMIPAPETILSVDISTNNFEAELGRATGAVTNVTLKSGTNAFHGSAFEFIQNNAVNARSYFSATPLGHLSYNYFGGTLGGPILKNKLFFFGGYIHSTDHENIANTFTVPPPQFYTPNAAGYIDLSAPLTSTGVGQIYNPASGDGTAAHPRTAFANNQIPISMVNPVSLAFIQALGKIAQPLPGSSIASPTNNFAINLPFSKSSDNFDGKIDFAPNEKNHLTGRYNYQRVNTYQAPAFGAFLGGPAASGFQGTGTQSTYSTGLNYDHVFSPTLFTEVRLGVAHLHNVAQPSDYGTNDATTIGVSGVNIGGQPFTSGQLGINMADFSQPLFGYNAGEPWIRAESNIDFVNNWTKVVRNHTLKAGLDLRRVRDDLLQDQTYSPRGLVTFSEPQTSDSRAKGTNVANNMASFLLDVPSAAGRDLNTIFPAYRQWWIFGFASDKWQASPKLTLDLGLRWEFYPPATPKVAGGFSNYDPVAGNLVIAGIGGNPSNLGMETRYRYFAPRTGFAYRATETTVIRGGFGISYTPFPDNNYAYNYPVRSNNSFTMTGSSPYTAAVLADGVTTPTFQAGFPAPVPAVIPSNGIIPINTPLLVSQTYTQIALHYKNPYVESWNVAVQQALTSNMSLQISYVANHGVDFSSEQNVNQSMSAYGLGAAGDPEYNCPGCAAASAAASATAGKTVVIHRTATTNLYFNPESSNYQSLQAQLTRRFANGLAFNSAFTWGKGMGYISGGSDADDGGLLFYINQRRNYAPNDFDRTLNFEQTFTYALPFGRGTNHFNSGIGAQVLGGWKLSGIISVVSGLPFTVVANGSSLNTPGTTQTASLSGPYKVMHGVGTSTHWFDPTAFTQPSGCPAAPAVCTAANVGLGNTGRNAFRGPGYIQDNVSLFKSFAIFREAALETRIDAFQLSNTPQFGNPNVSSITAGNFGQVTSTLGSGQGSVNGVGGGRSLQASAKITF